MAPTDERTTKPEQLVNVQNTNPGSVVQIPEGLYRLRKIHFHPLIVLKSQTLGPPRWPLGNAVKDLDTGKHEMVDVAELARVWT